MEKCQRIPNYYPNYYGYSRSQLLTPRCECLYIKTAISSIQETACRSSAYQKKKKRSNFPFKQVQKIWKDASKYQIITQIYKATTEANSRPQKAHVLVLKTPFFQSMKPQNKAPLTRRYQGNKISIQTGPENMKNNARESQIIT